MNNVLIIAAHPDDEVLGCGGTAAKLSAGGSQVHVLILAEGLTSRDAARDRSRRSGDLDDLAKTAERAAADLKVSSIELHDFPDNRMDEIPLLEVVKVIEKKIGSILPEIIFTHFGSDLNIDHQVTNQAVLTAVRPIPGQTVKEVYFFEVPSSTEWQAGQPGFAPNYFVPLTEDELGLKLKALETYRSEMRDFPHARSIEAVKALVRWRGASVGYPAAEAFMTARRIAP
jgi:LmbE family N-acetylglucosaminyl deacetylase